MSKPRDRLRAQARSAEHVNARSPDAGIVVDTGIRAGADKNCPNRSPRSNSAPVRASLCPGQWWRNGGSIAEGVLATRPERGGGGGLRKEEASAASLPHRESPRAQMYRPSAARGRGLGAGRSRRKTRGATKTKKDGSRAEKRPLQPRRASERRSVARARLGARPRAPSRTDSAGPTGAKTKKEKLSKSE